MDVVDVGAVVGAAGGGVTFRDFVPRDIGLGFNVERVIVGSEKDVSSSLITRLTQECVYYVVGTTAMRNVTHLSKLQCICAGDGGVDDSCEGCCRFEQLLQRGTAISDEELRDSLRWMNALKSLENSHLGQRIDLKWVNRFASIDWQNSGDCLVMLKTSLEPYLLPHSDLSVAKGRLLGRLQRAAQFQPDHDD
jgi:hypothetical protein